MLSCKDIKILIYRFREDLSKASTGVRIVKLGLASRIYSLRNIPKGSLILDPYAKEVLSPEDYSQAKAIIAIDRSWNVLSREEKLFRERGSFLKRALRRRLPFLRAANPINYAVAFKLSTAEAIAAASYIIGCINKAYEILRVFKWGSEFIKLNKEMLDAYSKASSRKEVVNLEKMFIEKYLTR